MMSTRLLVLVAVALGTAEALVERRFQRRSASCSCECCSVASRRADERTAGASVKCAPADGHSSDMCSDQCTPTPEDKVLGLIAEDGVLDYSRFCFYECKPADGVKSLVSTQCLALEAAEAERVVDAQGNPMDPAFLYAKVPEEAKKQLAHADQAAMLLRTGEPGDPEGVDLEEAHETGLDGRAAAKDAVEKSRKVLGRLSKDKVANDIPDITNSDDPLLLASRSRDHAARAQELADKAEEDAEQSIEALKSGRNETWKAAMWYANKGLNFMRRTDYRLATMHETASKPWRALSAYASRAAAAPYLQNAQYYEQTAPALQREAASNAMRRAKQLREKSEALDAEADILKRKGLVEEAKIKAEHADLTSNMAKDQEERAEDFVEAAKQDKKKARKNGYWADAKVAASQAVQKLELPVRYQRSHPPDPLLNWVPSAPDPNP